MDVNRLIRAVGGNAPLADAVVEGLLTYQDYVKSDSTQLSMAPLQRLVPYLAQSSHETGRFVHSREIWGPTAQQLKYDPKSGSSLSKTLGNVAQGDGFKFRGRGIVMVTGRTNYATFTVWVRQLLGDGPDFEAMPDLVEKAPWFGLSGVWFWTTGNSTKKTLNIYADEGNYEAITRKINGGLTGYDDRCELYVQYAMVALGYSGWGKSEVADFQRQFGMVGKDVDGIAGQKTRGALHMSLSLQKVTPLERGVLTTKVSGAGGGGAVAPYTSLEGLGPDGIRWVVDANVLRVEPSIVGQRMPAGVTIPRAALEAAFVEWGFAVKKP